MYRFARDEDSVDLERLRDRIRKIDDAALVRFGKAAAYMCSTAANMGKPPRQTFVIQLEEARLEYSLRRMGKPAEVSIPVSTETVDYGQGTHVVCKSCGREKIFLSGPREVEVRDEKRYLDLKCPSPACGHIRTYDEDELEIY